MNIKEVMDKIKEQCEGCIKWSGTDCTADPYKEGCVREMRCIQSTDNTKHMCEYCSNNFETCRPYKIKFGTGLGNDNVILCSEFVSKVAVANLPNYITGSNEFAKRYDLNNPNIEQDWVKNRQVL